MPGLGLITRPGHGLHQSALAAAADRLGLGRRRGAAAGRFRGGCLGGCFSGGTCRGCLGGAGPRARCGSCLRCSRLGGGAGLGDSGLGRRGFSLDRSFGLGRFGCSRGGFRLSGGSRCSGLGTFHGWLGGLGLWQCLGGRHIDMFEHQQAQRRQGQLQRVGTTMGAFVEGIHEALVAHVGAAIDGGIACQRPPCGAPTR